MTLLPVSGRESLINRILIITFGLFFGLNIYLHLSKADNFFFVDLRNRVVGARLMGQDISPYFFKWDPSYPETLQDPLDKCNIKNNMTTSPPSVLFLIFPVSKLSYTNICYGWILIHYLFFLLIILPFFFYFKDIFSRIAITITGIILLFSGQWVDSVFRGQTHFILPAIIAGMIALSAGKWKYRFIAIGLLFALLVWVRPNALVIFPFLLFCRQIKPLHIIGGFVGGAALLTGITLLLHHQSYWIDFYHSCREWASNNISGMKYILCQHKDIIEGKQVKSSGIPPYHLDREVFSLRDIIYKVSGVAIKYSYLMIGTVITYLAALLIVYKKPFLLFAEAVLTGLLLYWIFEIVSPIAKMSYYYVELFVVAFFLAGKFRELHITGRVLFIASMVFIFLDFVPINMTIAEILTIGSYLTTRIFNNEKNFTLLRNNA